MTRVDIVDSAYFTPAYDHALAAALGRRGADVRMVTSHFAYGEVPEPNGYRRIERFYPLAARAANPRLRRYLKAAEHGPAMIRYRRLARGADVVHFQWNPVPLIDRWLLPARPTVLTAHDLLPRDPYPGQLRAQRAMLRAVDGVIVHSDHGKRSLVDGLGLDPGHVHVVRHGAFDYLTRLPRQQPLDPELARVEKPVALFFGLVRPYKGVDVLLDAWRAVDDAELWVVGRPMMDMTGLHAAADGSVRFISRYVDEAEMPALFRRADVIVMPYVTTERYDFSGVVAAAMAFGRAAIATDVGSFSEVAEAGAIDLVPPADPDALAASLSRLLGDPQERERLARGAAAAAAGEYSWDYAAQRTLEVYRSVRGGR